MVKKRKIKHLSIGSKAPRRKNGKLRLYSMRYCPYAQRIHLVLDSKKIPHDVVYINLSQKPEWYQDKVPCLELENGDKIYESLIIAEYLDEAYPEHNLFSNDPLEKAKDKMLIKTFKNVSAAINKAYQGKGDDQDLLNEILKGLDIFDKELINRGTGWFHTRIRKFEPAPFFHGNKPGMLDLMIWPWFNKLHILRIVRGDQFIIPEKRYSKLFKGWAKAMKEDEGVKASDVDVLKHIKYMKAYIAGSPQFDF